MTGNAILQERRIESKKAKSEPESKKGVGDQKEGREGESEAGKGCKGDAA